MSLLRACLVGCSRLLLSSIVLYVSVLLGVLVWPLGASFGPLRVLLGSPLGLLGASWGLLGPSWKALGVILGFQGGKKCVGSMMAAALGPIEDEKKWPQWPRARIGNSNSGAPGSLGRGYR